MSLSTKKNLVRAHVIALKDGGKSLVLLVEVLVSPVGVDRINFSHGRKRATRAACAAG